MANAVDLRTRSIHTGSFGNASKARFPFTLANGDLIASTHDIGVLSSGIRVYDAQLYVSDPGPASTTLDIGLKSLVGTNQDDPDYFFAVTAATATGRTKMTLNLEPLLLAQDMYLRVTVQGANQNGTFAGTVVLDYVYEGNL